MSLIDLIARVHAIYRRYEMYDRDNHNPAFGSPYHAVEAAIEASLQQEGPAFSFLMDPCLVSEYYRNGRLLQTKAYLLEEVFELQKLALQKVSVLSNQEFVSRNNLTSPVRERVGALPDGIARRAKQTDGWATSASHRGIKISSTSDKRSGNDYCQQSVSSFQFRQGNEILKMKQD